MAQIPNPNKFNPFSLLILSLRGDALDPNSGFKSRPSMFISFCQQRYRENSPRFSVYLNNDPKDNAPKHIEFNTAIDFFSVLESFRIVVEKSEPDVFSWELKKTEFVGGKPSQEPIKYATLHVGKNTEGINYIKITFKGSPPAVFKFDGNTKYSNVHAILRAANGETAPISVLSNIQASAWINNIRSMVSDYLLNHSTPPVPREDKPQHAPSQYGASPPTSNNFEDDASFL